MPILSAAFTAVVAFSVSQAFANQIGNVEAIEEVFRSIPRLYKGMPDNYTCNFESLLKGAQILGVPTALSLKSAPTCSRAVYSSEEVQSCQASVILQWIRAFIGTDRGELSFRNSPSREAEARMQL